MSKESKPREWWIREATEHTEARVVDSTTAYWMFGGDDFWKSEYIQVIERSAYDQALELLREATNSLEALERADILEKQDRETLTKIRESKLLEDADTLNEAYGPQWGDND